MTRSASSSSSCGASPLDPSTTSPVSGVRIQRATLLPQRPLVKVSSRRNGVTIGVKIPGESLHGSNCTGARPPP